MNDIDAVLARLTDWNASKETHETRFSRVVSEIQGVSRDLVPIGPVVMAYVPAEDREKFVVCMQRLQSLFEEMGECIIDYGLDMVSLLSLFQAHLRTDHPKDEPTS